MRLFHVRQGNAANMVLLEKDQGHQCIYHHDMGRVGGVRGDFRRQLAVPQGSYTHQVRLSRSNRKPRRQC